MKLERGGLHAQKIGGDDAFGFYERTPSLSYAAKENPRLELHPEFDGWRPGRASSRVRWMAPGSSFIPSSMDGGRNRTSLPVNVNKITAFMSVFGDRHRSSAGPCRLSPFMAGSAR